MQTLLQSSTAKPLVFVMYDSADHVTGKTGLSPTVVISKNGASFGSPSGSVSEIGNGFYSVDGNATDTNTLGILALSATASGADQCTMAYEIVAYDPDSATNLGLGSIPTASPGSTNGLIRVGVNSGDITLDAISMSGIYMANSLTVAGTTTLTLAADTITASSVKADAVTKIQNGLAPSSTALSTAIWTGTKAAFLDAAITSRMATYTQPAGFLAATFPTTVASTTNITGGTITTVTNLTNAPTSGDLTATMKASISGLTIARVTLTDTVTTYTGNTPQTGDSFARIGATGSGLTSLAPSATALSTAVWTGTIAGRIDAAVSSRMASYTQPAGFLAATFPATVSSYAGGAVASVTGAVGSVASPVAITGDAATAGTRFLTMIESSAGAYRYTTLSLANSPSGTGGFTDDDRATLEAIPRAGETNTYTNTSTAETATVAIT